VRRLELKSGDLIVMNCALSLSPVGGGSNEFVWVWDGVGATVLLFLGYVWDRHYFVGPGGVGYRYLGVLDMWERLASI
jgi:hypothetical protein